MITNTGKNIIAKYLIGQAPAFASYLALGCGQRPRPTITTKSGVSTALISGTISSSANETPITGIASTLGLVVGMTLVKSSGTGSFGTAATIKSIDSPTQITIQATSANEAGSITFKTSTSGTSLLSVASTIGIWPGAKITITSLSSTGVLSTLSDTIVQSVNSASRFTVSPAPTTDLASATILLEIDPSKQSLDFEMFRVPISSRGYVNDAGVNKIVLTAQLPTEERYEISEIGLYSAGTNTAAGQYDSRTISAFSGEEDWKLSVGTTLNSPSTIVSEKFLDVATSLTTNNIMIYSNPAIKTSVSNPTFSEPTRAARYEKPRYLSNAILLKGDTSAIYPSNGNLLLAGTPSFLQITGQSVDLSKNSASDLMKLAFSLVVVSGESVPDSARVIIEFTNNDGSQYARMQVDAKNSVYNFSDNRYIVATKRLDELYYTSGQFSWQNVTTIKAYASTIKNLQVVTRAATGGVATLSTGATAHNLLVDDYVTVTGVAAAGGVTFNGTYKVLSTPTTTTFTYAVVSTATVGSASLTSASVEVPDHNFYIALDALRLDNVSTVNPLYGLVGYSIIQNTNATTIVKAPNTNNYIEYRFILDVT